MPWWTGPGPRAPPPQAAGISPDASRRCPRRSKRSAGRPSYAWGNAPASAAPEGNLPTRSSAPSHGHCVRVWGPWPRRSPWLPRPNPLKLRTPFAPGFARLSAETQPRFGGALAGVQRRQDTLVPRARQAPDGRTEGGTQPTESSVINRRIFLAPALPMDNVTIRGQHKEDNLTSIFPQLLTLEVIATLRLSRARKPQRSEGWRASAAGGCSARPSRHVSLPSVCPTTPIGSPHLRGEAGMGASSSRAPWRS